MAVRAFEVSEAAAGADCVDVPLGEDGAEPSLQRASPVEITEQGATIGSLAQPIEVREQGICQFARGWGGRRTAKDGASRGPQVAAKSRDEIIPGIGPLFGASASERQILQVECRKVSFDVARA